MVNAKRVAMLIGYGLIAGIVTIGVVLVSLSILGGCVSAGRLNHSKDAVLCQSFDSSYGVNVCRVTVEARPEKEDYHLELVIRRKVSNVLDAKNDAIETQRRESRQVQEKADPLPQEEQRIILERTQFTAEAGKGLQCTVYGVLPDPVDVQAGAKPMLRLNLAVRSEGVLLCSQSTRMPGLQVSWMDRGDPDVALAVRGTILFRFKSLTENLELRYEGEVLLVRGGL